MLDTKIMCCVLQQPHTHQPTQRLIHQLDHPPNGENYTAKVKKAPTLTKEKITTKINKESQRVLVRAGKCQYSFHC
jgi:uncharacterized protein (DUF1778 family)